MPNTSSAKKRLRQNEVRRLRNRSTKSDMRTQVRKVREAVKAGDAEKADSELKAAIKKLDRAGARKIIHPNAASRYKSRLSKAVKEMKQASASS